MRRDPRLSILVLASEPNVAAEVAFRARAVGCVAFAPRADESPLAAAFRLKPHVVLIDSGRAESMGDRIAAMADSLDAGLIVLCERAAVSATDSDRRRPALSLTDSDRAFVSALRAASSSTPTDATSPASAVARLRLTAAWAKRSSRNRAVRELTA